MFKEHEVLSIRNTVVEGFRKDLIVFGDGEAKEVVDLNCPIKLINNYYDATKSKKDGSLGFNGNQTGFTG